MHKANYKVVKLCSETKEFYLKSINKFKHHYKKQIEIYIHVKNTTREERRRGMTSKKRERYSIIYQYLDLN